MGAAVVGVTAATGVAQASATTISEAGSSLVFPLVSTWASHYTNNTVKAAAGGSSAGIADAASPGSSISIGASDAPETSAQYGKNSGDVVQIPWALSATGVGYHIKGVGPGLKLTGAILAEIYTGKITTWGNSAITKLNPKYAKKLKKAGKITPVFRSDGSGDSYAFQHFLTESAGKAWPYSYATAWGGSTGVGENGNAGVAGEVRSNAGTIGYISAYYLITQHINAAAIRNAAGNYEVPNPANISAAAQSNSTLTAQGANFTGISIVYPSRKYKTAYPISTYTYAIVNKGRSDLAAVKDFLTWATTTGQTYGITLDFVPLPAKIRSVDAGLINSI